MFETIRLLVFASPLGLLLVPDFFAAFQCLQVDSLLLDPASLFVPAILTAFPTGG